jgi:hypothetical protein
MKPLPRPTTITSYILVQLVQTPGVEGYFQLVIGGNPQQQAGPGFYRSKEEAQAAQIVMALKNQRAEIYEIEWDLA